MITIFVGSGWPVFSENTLMLYQQYLQLVPYFEKWQLVIYQGLLRYPINYYVQRLKWPKFLGCSKFTRIYCIYTLTLMVLLADVANTK